MGGSRWRVDLNTTPLVCWFSRNTNLSAIDSGGSLFVFDAKNGRVLRRRSTNFPSESDLSLRACVGVAGDGRTLAIGNLGEAVRIIDGLTGEQRKSWRHDGVFESIALSRDGTRMLTVGLDPTGSAIDQALRVWETETGRELRCIKFNELRTGDLLARLYSAALSPDGRTIAWIASSDARCVQLCDVTTGRKRDCPSSRAIELGRIAFTPDGHRIVAAGGCSALLSWDVASGKQIGDHAEGNEPLMAERMLISPDGRSLAACGFNGSLRVFDMSTGHERWHLDRRLDGRSSAPVFAPDGKALFVWFAGTDRLIHRYSAETGESLDEADLHGGPVTCVCFSADGKTLFTLGRDQRMRSWSASTGELQRSSPVAHEWPAFAVSGDRRYTASAKDECVTVYEMATGAQYRQFAVGNSAVYAVGLSPDASHIVAVARDSQRSPHGTIRSWEMASGKELGRAVVHEGRLTDLFMSSDRRVWCGLAIPPAPQERLLLRMTSTGRTLSSARVPEDYCGVLCLSPDARTVVMSSLSGRRLALIETATARPRLLWSVDEPVGAAALSRDGRILATGHVDGTLRFWDAYNGCPLAARQAHEGQIYSVDFDPAGSYAATGSWDGTALVWDLRELGLHPAPLASRDRAELPKLWGSLGSGDAQLAYRSIVQLTALGDVSVSFLAERIQRLPPSKASTIMYLIQKLNDAHFARREEAVRELIQMGSAAEPALRTALAGEHLPEVRLRIEKVLSSVVEPALSSEEVRTLRAIEVLERIGSEQARQALVKIQSRAASGRTSNEVAASLARLASRRQQ
jgi:WD40 repeat protein